MLDDRQRLGAAHRVVERQRGEIAFARERLFQQPVIAALGHLDRAEGAQVVGDELGVEQPEAAGFEPRDQVHQRDLRSVARAVEHALAEEGAAERDAVEPADQIVAVIDLDAVAMAVRVERAVDAADAAVDPGAGAAGLGLGAAVDHRLEVAVDADREGRGAHGARQPPRHVEALERDDAAHLRLDPVERGIVGAFRHRKDAAGIGLEQHFRRDLDEGVFAAGHGGDLVQGGPRRAEISCRIDATVNEELTITLSKFLKRRTVGGAARCLSRCHPRRGQVGFHGARRNRTDRALRRRRGG